MSEIKRQSAEVRGDIQKGVTGDKVPGFDPAAAPMETDAEAGGARALQPTPETTAPRPTNNRDANASSDGDAMRPFEADQPSGDMHRWLIVFAVLIAIVVVVVFILSA